MKILSLSCHYHESAAAFLVNGRIVAAIAQERLTRKKHDAGFPKEAIDACLRIGKTDKRRLDYVVFYEKPLVKFTRNLETSIRQFPRSRAYFVESMSRSLGEKLWIRSAIADYLNMETDKILFVPHHLSHAAAAFYPSPFTHAAVLTLDGIGEWTTGAMGLARNNTIEMHKELMFPHSVGLLYSTFTSYLGFEVNDGEYKVMGMAAYGKPKYLDRVRRLYHQSTDGSITLNLTYFSFHYSPTRMYTQRFIKLFEGCNRFDVAASIQKATEQIVLTLAGILRRETGEENLVYGGGVALNSVVNGKLLRESGFKNIYIFPAAGDDGAAAGAALYVYHHVLGNKKRYPVKDVFLGQKFKSSAIRKYLIQEKVPYTRMRDDALVDYISDAFISGKVVGWLEGRSEFGPRALGHRSILADPKDPKMKDTVNRKIKFREEFRPFAPVVLAEHAKKYFPDADRFLSPFMLATVAAGRHAKRSAPAVVHVDGTSRIQTVDRNYTGRYRKLLGLFYKKTGRPILLNTSFNLRGGADRGNAEGRLPDICTKRVGYTRS